MPEGGFLGDCGGYLAGSVLGAPDSPKRLCPYPQANAHDHFLHHWPLAPASLSLAHVLPNSHLMGATDVCSLSFFLFSAKIFFSKLEMPKCYLNF